MRWLGIEDGHHTLSHKPDKDKVATEKLYKINNDPAILFVRPRGLHLAENNVTVKGEAISASLFDFGVYFANNCISLMNKGSRPYFYLPKLEHSSEAKLWNDVFVWSQQYLGIPVGTIKCTVLIEHLSVKLPIP